MNLEMIYHWHAKVIYFKFPLHKFESAFSDLSLVNNLEKNFMGESGDASLD